MTLLPRSLGGRLILVAAVLIVVILSGAAALTGVFLWRFVTGGLDRQLDGQIAAVAGALVAGPDGRPVLAHPVEGPPPFDRRGWYWEVIGDDGFRLGSPLLNGANLTLPPPPPYRVPGMFDRAPAGDGPGPDGMPLHFRIRPVEIGGRTYTVVATAPRAVILRPVLDALTPVLIALGLAGIALLLALFIQVRLGLRPLAALRTSVADVRAGRRERVPADQPSEIAPLVSELNRLIEDNEAGLERARRHVANLAHGLKTPLASLALAMEAEGRDPDATLRALVGDMDRRVRHHLARARAAALHGPARARTPVAPRAADIAAIMPRIHPGKPLAVELAVPGDIAVACEVQDLDEMLGNLLDNAARWSVGKVRVSGEAQGDRVAIRVEDDGPGLPGDAIPAALSPGLRLDENAPGYGFGLPITRELAELYGGALELGRSPLGGLAATLVLPAARG